ncbi:MAG: purine-nucleoside phosphorylase [Ruminococcaceae bacterium]|nr:purine-nucleoside phosphorylase [Oscillospiraceae bacterium]
MSEKTPTPHIKASPSDIAKVVLMPGDPLRSEYVAKNFLENPVLFNNVRGVQGYTGEWNGKRVSVMASGMGMPSIGIYSYELYNFFDVDCIIRIGSAGALQEQVKVRDIVFGMGACTNSAYSEQYALGGHYAPICDYKTLECAVELAKQKGLEYHVGNLFSSDTFYDENGGGLKWKKMGVLAVEMEAAALYMNAARAGKKALAICTVSDSLVTGESTTSDERMSGFTDMMRLALDVAAKIQE